MNVIISYAITTLCIFGIIFVCIQIVNLIGYIFKPKKCDDKVGKEREDEVKE